MQVRRSPKLVAMVGSATKSDTVSVDTLYLGEDGNHYAVDFGANIIPATIATLTAHLAELSATQSPDRNLPVQALKVHGMSLSMSENGDVGFQLDLDGSTQLQLHFPREQTAALVSTLEDLKDLLTRRVQ